jgi:hypothetical protein
VESGNVSLSILNAADADVRSGAVVLREDSSVIFDFVAADYSC